MLEKYPYDNISTEEFLDIAETMILQNPDMSGVEIEDNNGRTWFIQLTSDNIKTMN